MKPEREELKASQNVFLEHVARYLTLTGKRCLRGGGHGLELYVVPTRVKEPLDRGYDAAQMSLFLD